MLHSGIATAVVAQLESGRNRALILRVMDNESSDLVEVVVKLRSRINGVSWEQAYVAEAVCSQLAIKLGLKSPIPYIVEVTEDLVANSKEEFRADLMKSQGRAFGSVFLEGMTPLNAYMNLENIGVEEAGDVVGFDIFLFNPDRKEGVNPNLGLINDELVVFDHDLALNWGVFFPPIKPKDADLLILRQHALFYCLTGTQNACDSFETRLAELSRMTWVGVFEALPSEWLEKSSQNEMCAFLDERQQKRHNWISEVHQCLTK